MKKEIEITGRTIAKTLAVVCVVIWIILLVMGLTSDRPDGRGAALILTFITLIAGFIGSLVYLADTK